MMPLGPGELDAQGVYHYGEADVEALASDLLNRAPTSISTQLALIRADIDSVEAFVGDTGWIAVSSFSGSWVAVASYPVAYRRINGVVHLRGRVSGGTSGTVFTLPAGFRPGQTGFRAVISGDAASVAMARVTLGDTGAVQAVAGQLPNFDGIQIPVG